MLGFTVHIVSDPDSVERVMLGNKANYERPGIARRILSPLIGNGLLSAQGDDWRKQRRIVAPTFAPGAVAAMGPLMDAAALREVERWPAGAAGLDIASAATRTTMAIIADALFGGDPRLLDPAAARHIETMLAAAGQARFVTMLGLQDLDPSPGTRPQPTRWPGQPIAWPPNAACRSNVAKRRSQRFALARKSVPPPCRCSTKCSRNL